MKVIAPYTEILEDLDRQSLATRIEACGRICYKSEDKITAASAEPFVRNIIKHGHNSVTEMAVLTLRVFYDKDSMAAQFFSLLPKFLHIDRVEKKEPGKSHCKTGKGNHRASQPPSPPLLRGPASEAGPAEAGGSQSGKGPA